MLGLQHEHQRPDADQHVHFLCVNLYNYEAIADKITKEHPDWTIEQACGDIDMAFELGFSAQMYIQEPTSQTQLEYGSDFDPTSIMMYPSKAASKEEDNSLAWPLVLRPTPPNGDAEIKFLNNPSAKDVAAIIAKYS